MQIKTVTQVTQRVKALLDDDPELQDLCVEGEVSNFTRASSGHCYFTLKDAESELRCVMWRHQVTRLLEMPVQGDWVEAHGYISVYERGGAYQFYVDALQRGGIGSRWRELQKLKARLQAEGLFDIARKRALPRWPHRIGVVTSPTGAAFQDILNVLRARYPLVEVVLSPSLVQGVDAPDSLVQAIERLNQLDDLDVIIVARGGGSLEDLWAFNDERVARAVAASRVPTVSGVGHEIDLTITDLVADLRAPTPSAAAAAVVPDVRDLRQRLDDMQQALAQLVVARLGHHREQLARAERLLRVYEPRRLIAEYLQRVDDLVHRAGATFEHRLSLWRAHLRGSMARLRALDPHLVLQRGYAIAQDRASGRTLVSVNQASLGQEIGLRIRDGLLGAKVTEIVEIGNP